MCVRSLSTQPKLLSLIILATSFLMSSITAREPVKLDFLLLLLLLLHIFPNVMRGLGEIRIPQHHCLIKCVGLNRKMPTCFSSEIVRNGDDGADRDLQRKGWCHE